jgi:hypothetical protein
MKVGKHERKEEDMRLHGSWATESDIFRGITRGVKNANNFEGLGFAQVNYQIMATYRPE